MQRRYGLYVSQALPTFALLASQGDTRYDPLGDHITNEGETDRSAPHRAALRQWHSAHQATTAHAIVLGDKAPSCTPSTLQHRLCGRPSRGADGQGRHRPLR